MYIKNKLLVHNPPKYINSILSHRKFDKII